MFNSHFFRSTRAGLLFITLFLFQIATGFSQETKSEKKVIRLLTIGNSFANNATTFLSKIAVANGDEFILGQANIGNSTMEKHWVAVEISEKDPADPKGKPYGGKSLKEKLTEDKWDYVTIQQISSLASDPASFQPYVKNFCDYIKKHAPQAEILLHKTWAYRVDDPQFIKKPRPDFPSSSEEMYEKIKTSYDQISKEFGLRIIPTGEAFHRYYNDPNGKFTPDANFNPDTAKEPALPDQTNSLQVGWSWKKEKDAKEAKLINDIHANRYGQYLGGCVFYEFLFKKSVVGNSFRTNEMNDEKAAVLQKAAHEAVNEAAPAATSENPLAPKNLN